MDKKDSCVRWYTYKTRNAERGDRPAWMISGDWKKVHEEEWHLSGTMEWMMTETWKKVGKQVGGSHYKDMPIQPIEFIVANSIPYREGNAIKYICRHRNKNGKQDIEKAIHYLEMILEDYGDQEESTSDVEDA